MKYRAVIEEGKSREEKPTWWMVITVETDGGYEAACSLARWLTNAGKKPTSGWRRVRVNPDGRE